jgi:GAF domain-containing protein
LHDPPRDITHRLAEPLLLVSESGETLDANPAFHDLAAHCSAEPRLASLFGAAVSELLAQALRAGHTCACLPVQQGAEPRLWFRLSLTGDTGSRTVAVLAMPMNEEMAWRRQLDKHHRELAMLKDVGNVLSGTVELEQLTERIYEQTAQISQAGNFYIALYDREAGTVSFPRYLENGMWQEMTSRPLSNGLTEHILRTGQALLFNGDVLEQARARGIEPIGRPCCAWIGVPMVADGETLGVIGLQDYERNDAYDEHDLELLGIIAAQAAAAIRSARLLASARRAYEELSEVQARLLETERTRGVTETVGALNHEVNNPLAIIAGNAQLLLRRPESLPPATRRKIEHILEAARRIQHVTTKMSTLIQATSMPYPGEGEILDVRRSRARGEAPEAGARSGATPERQPD